MSFYTERRTLAQDEVLKHVLAALAVEGRTEIRIPRDVMLDEVFRAIAIKIVYDADSDSHTVHILYNRPKVIAKSEIEEADFEIIEEAPSERNYLGPGPIAK